MHPHTKSVLTSQPMVYENAHAKIREDPNIADADTKSKEYRKTESNKFAPQEEDSRVERYEVVNAKITAKRPE